MNIALFSGELSGDLIGGALARELKQLAPQVELWGLGSAAMRAEGVELIADSATWGAISVTEAVGKIPALLMISQKVKRAVRERRPDVVVLIDFGAYNMRAARYCKRLGLKVCYYFPPGSWRRTGNRGADLAQLTDVVAAPFPWTAERLQGLGVNAHYVGHPLVERVQAQMTRAEFCSQFGMAPECPIIGLLPGSREQEVRHLTPTLLEAARRIYQEVPDAQFVVAVANSISPEMMAGYLSGEADLKERLQDIWHEFTHEAETKVLKPVARTANALRGHTEPTLLTAEGVPMTMEQAQEKMRLRRLAEQTRQKADKMPPPTVLAKGVTYDVMAHSDLLLTCSGTATLEATVFTTPMVILYRGSKIMEFEYKLRGLHRKLEHIGLPNILAGRRIVPELIQDAATPENIVTHALPLLNDLVVRQQMRDDLRTVREALGEPGASARTAKLVMDLIVS